MRFWSCLLLGASLAACSASDVEITLKFATPEARARTRFVAFTAFEPIIAQPDTEDQIPRFVDCDDIGVFPPTRLVDPDTITTVPNLAGVISERTSEAYPLDGDWNVDLESTGLLNTELNPWGAMMVYVEARGDARAPESRGGGQVSATLLSGCFCIRTREASFIDLDLDTRVKRACPAIEGDGSVTEQEVELAPVIPEEFALQRCDGIVDLTAPRNEVLSPGPSVCLDTTRCDALTVPGPCFSCEQPCSELNDQSNVPVQFDVFRGNDAVPFETQVVLSDLDGKAEAQVDVGDCGELLRVEAHVLGRAGPRQTFNIECVDTLQGFACPVEFLLPNALQPRAMARVLGNPDACRQGDERACDRLAVISDDGGDRALLSIRDPRTGETLTSTSFPAERGYAVHSFFYELPGPGQLAADPLIAVATADETSRDLRLRVFSWRFDEVPERMLQPHDGRSGILEKECQTWVCGSLQPCTDASMCPLARESCRDNICQNDAEPEDMCTLPAPLYCSCEQKVEVTSQVTIRTRDLDRDGRADLAVGNNGDLNLNFFYSADRAPGTRYADNCTCGLFGVAPNAFDLATFGGEVPNPSDADLVIGGNGGMFVRYADRVSTGIPTTLRCGGSNSVGDNAAVRDVQVEALRCREDDLICGEYEDVVTVAARTVSGGTLNDPGAVRITSGSPTVLSPERRIPEGIQRELTPRRLSGRQSRPEDPQRARIADFNGDGHRDLAVLYKGSQEVHVWLGASNGGFGELTRGILLNQCLGSAATDCPPLSDLVALDSNGDGLSELAVICSPSQLARVRIYEPQP